MTLTHFLYIQNVNTHMYHNREQFLEDVELLVVNSEKYNGKDSNFTGTARRILQVAADALTEVGFGSKIYSCSYIYFIASFGPPGCQS